MAILRNAENLDNTINYIASVAFFCCISCVTLMLKFSGFKASLNIFNGKRHSKGHDELAPGLSISGAYRTNRHEYFENGRLSEPPKRLTPSMVKLPESHENTSTVEPAKTVSDITKTNNLPTHLRLSTPSVSLDPRGDEDRAPRNSKNGRTNTAPSPNQEKEQAEVRKKLLAEQRARDKLAAQERAKQEKLAKAREKKEAKDKAKRTKKVKAPAPQPQKQISASLIQTSTVPQQSANPLAHISSYPTNTLESSISRSSGPPPYSEVPTPVPKPELVKNENDATGNVSFSKPIDTGSWDMVTQHRQQVTRTTNATEIQNKQRVMDLNYNFNNNDKDNSEA